MNSNTNATGGSYVPSQQPGTSSWGMTRMAVLVNAAVTLLLVILPFVDRRFNTASLVDVSISYWVAAAIIGWRRKDALTRGDRLFLAAGQLTCYGAAVVGLAIFT